MGLNKSYEKIKGIFLINSIEGGGAEKVFTKLVKMIDDDNDKIYDIKVVLLDDKDDIYQLPENIEVIKIGSSGFFQLFKFYSFLSKEKPSFVCSFLMRANFFNVFLSLFLNYKSIISERSNTDNRIRGRFKKLKKIIIKNVYKKASTIICCSKGVYECLLNSFDMKKTSLVIINNPYNLAEISNLAGEVHPQDESYILAIGRLVKTKGFDDLIKSYATLNLDIKLKIMGEGPEEASLKMLCEEYKLTNRVEFLGFKNNPYPIIKGSYFYVLSSYTEGFPNTLVEAMSLGKPVISSNCPDGPDEILEPRTTIAQGDFHLAKYGLMFNTGDILALQKAMNMLLKNRDLYNELEQKSLDKASFYTDELFYSKFKKVINGYINNG